MLATHYQAQAHELPATGSIPPRSSELGGFIYANMRQLTPGKFAIVPCKSVEGLDPYCQTVYMWLCQHANDSNQCWPSIATLMAKCGIKSRSKVQDSIKTLSGKGLVKKDERKEDGISTSNLYEVFYEEGPQYGLPPSVIKTTPVRNTDTELKPLEPKPIELKESHVAIATVPQFGKEYVNGILAAIEEAHGSVDGKKQEGRQFAHLLAKKLEKGGVPIDKVPDTIKAVIAKAQETGNSFIIGQTTSPKALFQNWAKIGVALKSSHQKNTVLEIPSL